jgi:hypothetical protein
VVKVNDEYGNYLQTKKGVRQGGYAVLFNIVVDMLAILINRAKGRGSFSRCYSTYC